MDDGALVPTWPYYEEASYEQPPMMYEEQSMVSRDMYEPPLHDSHQRANNFSQNDGVSLSQGTLMFIANQGEVRQNSYPARPYAQQNRPIES